MCFFGGSKASAPVNKPGYAPSDAYQHVKTDVTTDAAAGPKDAGGGTGFLEAHSAPLQQGNTGLRM